LTNYFENYQKNKLRTANISVVISISVVLFLLALLGFFLLNSERITNHFKEKIIITVFFKEDTKMTEIKRFEKSLKLKDEIKLTKFVSKEQAASNLKGDIGEDFVEFLGKNPLRDNLEVILKGDFVNEEMIENLKNDWKKNSFVSDVNYDYYKPLIKTLNNNVKKVTFWVLLISGFFVFLVFLLINSAIRLSVYSKRFTIKTMQMVGATKSFIRKPFLLKAVIFGIIGATLASLGVLGILYYVDKHLPDFQFLEDIKLMAILIGGLYFLGTLITLISTFFATRRFLNLTSDQLHY